MGIGAYRHLVTLTHPAVAIDPPTWYCSLEPATAQVADGQAAYLVKGRYHGGVTLETRLLFEGRTLQIQSVADVGERHRELVCFAVEVVARGSQPH
jgi:hypothetical protein